MTKDDLARLRVLCEEATPGEWVFDPPECFQGSAQIVCESGDVAESLYPPDAQFIAAAHSALPALLDELDRLRLVVDAGTATIRRLEQNVRDRDELLAGAQGEIERLRDRIAVLQSYRREAR